MSNLLDLSFQKQESTCQRRIRNEYSEIEEDPKKRVKASQNISVTNIEVEHSTPKIGAKQLEFSQEESDFLDEIGLNIYDDLSHISENNNISDKWQDESSIDSLLDSSSRRGVQKLEEEERREQELIRYQEELTGYLGLINNEEKQKIVDMITQMIEITRSFKGRIISYKPLTIQCRSGHKWTTDKDALLRKEWCQQCVLGETPIFRIDTNNQNNNQNKIPVQNQELPSFKNLPVNDIKSGNPVDVQGGEGVVGNNSGRCQRKCKCSRGRASLCKDCKLSEKLQRQRVQMESKKKLFEKYEEQQKSLYESAKKQFKRGEQSHKIIEAFKEMEQEIEKSALVHAQKYIERLEQPKCVDSDSEKTIIRKNSNDSTLNSSSEEVNSSSYSSSRSNPILPYLLALYKILLIPDEALAMYIKAQQKSILIQEYRLYARLVHPDKNRHPKAPVAFLKLRKYWMDLQRDDKIIKLH